jgi:hypothetical protein
MCFLCMCFTLKIRISLGMFAILAFVEPRSSEKLIDLDMSAKFATRVWYWNCNPLGDGWGNECMRKCICPYSCPRRFIIEFPRIIFLLLRPSLGLNL